MPRMSQPDAAHRLAAHAAGLRFADIPPEAVAKAKVFILDTLGVGIAGGSVPEAAPLLATARGWGQGSGVSVWGTRERLAPGAAALVNAFQIHCQEYDNLHEGAVLHSMATLLPVLLAEAEIRGGVSGAGADHRRRRRRGRGLQPRPRGAAGLALLPPGDLGRLRRGGRPGAAARLRCGADPGRLRDAARPGQRHHAGAYRGQPAAAAADRLQRPRGDPEL